MVERTGERRLEREPMEAASDIMHRYMETRTRQMREGAVIVKGEGIDWEQGRQSLIKAYLHPGNWSELGVPGWIVFKNYVKKHSGKHCHQGGLAILVLQGKGYTVVDGTRYDWEKDDLILLPIIPGGCEHEHFNSEPDKPAEWLAFIFMAHYDALGNELVQLTTSPDYQGATVRVASPPSNAG